MAVDQGSLTSVLTPALPPPPPPSLTTRGNPLFSQVLQTLISRRRNGEVSAVWGLIDLHIIDYEVMHVAIAVAPCMHPALYGGGEVMTDVISNVISCLLSILCGTS